jgi:hypothetical protein
MKKNETAQIMTMISLNYTAALLPEGWKTSKEMALEIWHSALGDLSFDDAKKSLLQYFSSDEKYPPTIADIRRRVMEMNSVDEFMPVEQAWGTVIDAIRKFGYVDKAGALESLQGATRAIVECFTWEYYCAMPIDNVSTYFAQFRAAYNARISCAKEQKQLPEHLRTHRADAITSGATGSNFEKREYSQEYIASLPADVFQTGGVTEE